MQELHRISPLALRRCEWRRSKMGVQGSGFRVQVKGLGFSALRKLSLEDTNMQTQMRKHSGAFGDVSAVMSVPRLFISD
jgi:hypothetical protein